MRQKLSQREILRRAVAQYDAHGFVDEPVMNSARRTAVFLWGMVAIALFAALTWLVFARFGRAEHDGDDAPRASLYAPGTKHGEAKFGADAEGNDVGHGAQPASGKGGGA